MSLLYRKEIWIMIKTKITVITIWIIIKTNKIAQGEINIFSHFNIRGYVPFSRFFRLNRKWLHQSAKYYQIRAQQVRISRKRHLTCLCRTLLILAAIFGEKRAQTYARFLIKPEVTGRFCWFSIANTGWPNSRSCAILKWIRQKLRPWNCRIRNELNGRYDVIKLKIWKSEKNDTGRCPKDYLCEISSKSAEPFRL